MPLRDHFHAPLRNRRHWEGFHSDWASSILRHLNTHLPSRYFAEPHTHLGIQVEADLATFEEEPRATEQAEKGNGVATAVWAPPQATQTLVTDIPAQDVFEVRVYDEERGIRLVAVIELVSPRNKDRPEARQAFVRKCATYLQERVSLVIVDVVTERHQNLHTELMEALELTEAKPFPEDVDLYAAAYRMSKPNDHWQMDTWNERLGIAAPLPTLPLWLASNLAVPLELEVSYEETCRVLRIE
jgi:Protein of unknown function (DUF4058)